jgi:hypothetical protein
MNRLLDHLDKMLFPQDEEKSYELLVMNNFTKKCKRTKYHTLEQAMKIVKDKIHFDKKNVYYIFYKDPFTQRESFIQLNKDEYSNISRSTKNRS